MITREGLGAHVMNVSWKEVKRLKTSYMFDNLNPEI